MKSRVYIVAGVLYLFAYFLLEWISDALPILDKASYIGIATSMIGLPIAIHQIVKAKSASLAAKKSTIDAREKLTETLTFIDLEKTNKLVDQIKDFIKRNEIEAATIRIRDLREITVKLKKKLAGEELDILTEFQFYLVNFKQLEQLLLKDRKIPKKTIESLLDFSSFINGLTQEAILNPTED